MKLPSYPKAPFLAHRAKGALFVDLDETLLEGTVTKMDDNALKRAQLNQNVIYKIRKALSQGMKIALVTRNAPQNADRFFDFFPHVRGLFTAIFASLNAPKSEPIHSFLKQHRLVAEKSEFLDDNLGERDEVEKNITGIRAHHPSECVGAPS